MVDAVAEVTTRFYYDGGRVLLETDGSDTDQRLYVWGNYIDEVLIMTDDLGATPDDRYFGHDHLHSTVVLFDDSGNVVERYEYDAYGNCVVYTDDGADDTWFTSDDTSGSYSALGKNSATAWA